MPEPPDKIREIYAFAVKLAVEEQGPYLDKACAGDQELRATVDKLLSSERPDSVLEWSTVSSRDMPATSVDAGANLLETGVEFKDSLGTGGFSEVYRAIDRSLNRQVALKVLRPHHTLDSRERERFIQEARTLASLKHPNIVQIYSIDDRDDQLQIQMELIDGRTLAQIGREDGPFSAQEAVRVGVDLCRALAAIHDQGLVHGDVKPANVMRERGGRLVLLDFGMARASAPQDSSGDLKGGTPLVMAPEQFDTEQAVCPQTDLYALGVVLYWLVSGHYPYRGKTLADLRELVLNAPPTPLVDVAPSVPDAFVPVVERAMARNISDRFSSAGVMEQELRPLLSATAVPARPWGRSAALSSGAALVLLAVLFIVWKTQDGEPSVAKENWFATQFYRVRDTRPMAVHNGDEVQVGDRLTLQLSLEQRAHVYVFNEDEEGSIYRLFPLDGLDISNPLTPGQHELPGQRDGEEQYWMVSSAGIRESFVILASHEPHEAAQALARAIPAASVAEQNMTFAALEEETRSALRGVGRVVAEPAASPLPPQRLDEFLMALEQEDVPAANELQWEVIRLRNISKKE